MRMSSYEDAWAFYHNQRILEKKSPLLAEEATKQQTGWSWDELVKEFINRVRTRGLNDWKSRNKQ